MVKPQGTGTTEETVSFEEQMRRERLRDRSTGVTEYYWYATEGACKPTLTFRADSPGVLPTALL